MLDRYLHIIGWKNEGKWDTKEVLLDYSVVVTALLVVTSAILYVAL